MRRSALEIMAIRPIRQLSILDLGHEDPTILLTNDHARYSGKL